jgi:hypothetical protein
MFLLIETKLHQFSKFVLIVGLIKEIGHNSGSFLWRQLSIDNYHVKKYFKESQFLLFSRQKVYKNAKFVYITEIL